MKLKGLIGVARSVTDFAYCCYLSDLAVNRDFQRRGIGSELMARTQDAAGGDKITMVLLWGPAAWIITPRRGWRSSTTVSVSAGRGKKYPAPKTRPRSFMPVTPIPPGTSNGASRSISASARAILSPLWPPRIRGLASPARRDRRSPSQSSFLPNYLPELSRIMKIAKYSQVG